MAEYFTLRTTNAPDGSKYLRIIPTPVLLSVEDAQELAARLLVWVKVIKAEATPVAETASDDGYDTFGWIGNGDFGTHLCGDCGADVGAGEPHTEECESHRYNA